jgi:S1-C subfamily serine protease
MKGVPFTFFFSGLHADYHKVTDHAEKLAYDNMVRVGRTAAQVLLALANSPETLASRKLEFGKSAPVVKKRTLGLELEDLAEGERGKLGLEGTDSGLLVKVVRAGSVAAAAGLRIDDVLVGVNGKPLAEGKEVETLRTVLDGVKPGTDVPIDVIRDGARRTLQGRWTE